MSIKTQLIALKDNWLLVVLVLLAIGIFIFYPHGYSPALGAYSPEKLQESKLSSYVQSLFLPRYDSGFAPEESTRLITKTASLVTEIKLGAFSQKEIYLKYLIKENNAYLLNENVNTYESGRRSYKVGQYTIKIDTAKYDEVIAELKKIGEVKSFNENMLDITAQHKKMATNLEAEKERLNRFKEMLKDAQKMEDKITLTDRIYELERTIKSMEESLKNIENKVDYSTIYFTMAEKQSDYANIALVKLSELVNALVNSVNSLFKIVFWLIPYAIVAAAGWFVYKKLKRTSSQNIYK